MAKRKYKRRSRKRPFPVGKKVLWIILVVQTLWLAGFIWSTGSPLPSGIREWSRERRQEQKENRMLQELLSEEGSKGPATPGEE